MNGPSIFSQLLSICRPPCRLRWIFFASFLSIGRWEACSALSAFLTPRDTCAGWHLGRFSWQWRPPCSCPTRIVPLFRHRDAVSLSYLAVATVDAGLRVIFRREERLWGRWLRDVRLKIKRKSVCWCLPGRCLHLIWKNPIFIAS